MTIGERIRYRRKQLGLSADELAVKLNKNRATIYRYEGNEIEKFPASVLESLATALDVTPAFLMGWEDNVTEGIVNLTDEEKLLVAAYRKATKENRQVVLHLLNALDKVPEDKQQILMRMIDAVLVGM